MLVQKRGGFTLIEAMIAIGILLIFASGVYGGIRLVFQVVYQSRLRIIESALLNEEIEIVRNMSFFDIGIVNGSPSGPLERTVTASRNGIDFLITRTIRNIDDPFDGTIDAPPQTPPDGKVYVCHSGNTLSVGAPALQAHLNHGDYSGPCSGSPEAGDVDQSPADYKFVEISVICTGGCRQRAPLTASTLIGPKYLEGDPTHGALFIEVIDASGVPVQGATVHLLSTSTDPTYDFEDTTDNEGFIRIVDLAEGQNAYHITISKDGYTTDGTTTSVANATKPPASVVAQDVTSRTFSIDLVSELDIFTQTALCAPVASVSSQLTGNRVVATDPDVLLVNKALVTNVSGEKTLDNLPWDTYSIIPSGYDLIGAIPMLPIEMLPGASTEVTLILGPSTNHSLLVHVEDSGTGDAISSSTVSIEEGGNELVQVTGIGTLRQLDWSGGAGQSMHVDATRYASDDGNLSIGGDIDLADLSGAYVTDGWLESSTFDLGGATNFVSLDWSPYAQPIAVGTSSVRLQFATSNTSSPANWDFVGPDGTNNTYYTSAERTLFSGHSGDRYGRYRLYLHTASTTYTPTVSDIAFTYVAACTPPGQAYFGDLESETYTVTVSAVGYSTYASEIEVSGATRLIVPLASE